MSYTRHIGDMGIYVDCIADPETTYSIYYRDIEKEIIKSGYEPKTSMENLISMVVLHFDCDDNYNHGDGDEEGYGDQFSMVGLLQFVEDCGGWEEFDYEV